MHAADTFGGNLDLDSFCRDEQGLVAFAPQDLPLTSELAKRILGDADHRDFCFERAVEVASQAGRSRIVKQYVPVDDDRVQR